MNTRSKCLKILRLKENPSMEEIKHAFRVMVKEVHPDISNDDQAQSDFIKIRLAYEYLIKNYEEEVQIKSEKGNSSSIRNSWSTEERQEWVKKRKKHYEEIDNYDHSTIGKIIDTGLTGVFGIASYGLLMMAFVIAMSNWSIIESILLGFALILITSFYISRILKSMNFSKGMKSKI